MKLLLSLALVTTYLDGLDSGLMGIKTAMRTLRLTLKRQWFDMIASGEKPEEYREPGKWIASRVNANKEYDVVEFANGYGPNVPRCVVEYRGYDWSTGNPAWGAVPGKKYIVIRLGAVLSVWRPEALTVTTASVFDSIMQEIAEGRAVVQNWCSRGSLPRKHWRTHSPNTEASRGER